MLSDRLTGFTGGFFFDFPLPGILLKALGETGHVALGESGGDVRGTDVFRGKTGFTGLGGATLLDGLTLATCLF